MTGHTPFKDLKHKNEKWRPEWHAWPSWKLVVRHPLRSIAVRFHLWGWLDRMDARLRRRHGKA